MCYDLGMDKTLTIRISTSQDEALTKRARALRRTRSQLVRDLIEKGLEEQPLARRIGHIKGRLKLQAPRPGWQRQIKDRNWR